MKGLSFSEPMVKAWLEGRKTVTRRLMNPEPSEELQELHSNGVWKEIDGQWWMDFPGLTHGPWKPRYLPGETVYIKETWCQPVMGGLKNISLARKVNAIEYAADMGIERFPIGGNYTPRKEDFKWKSPRFMPEWASRSKALIVSVRPERVREINEIDAFLEGFRDELREDTFYPVGAQFKEIWNKLHPGSWESNDWVWRIELEKLDASTK